MNFPSNLPDIISAKLETWREEQQAIRRIAAAVDIQEPIVRHFDILNAIAKLKRDITELAAANKAIATENNRIMQTARGIKTTSDKLRECANKLADAEAKLEQLATTENDNCDLRAELERIYEIVGDPKDLEATLLLLVDDGAIETGRRCGFQQGLRFAAERLIDWDQTNQHSSQCAGYLNAWIEPKLSLRTELAATCLDSNSPSLAKAIRSGDRCPEVFRREQDGQLERCRGVLVYEQGHDADRNHPGDPECLYCEECGETFPITNEIVSIVPASEMSEDLQSSEGRSRSSDHRYGTALDIIQSDGQEIGHLEGKIEELERRLAEANSGLDVNVDWLAERITVVVWKTLKLSVSRGDRGRDRLVAAIRHTLENRRADAFTEGVAAIGKSFKVEHFPIVNPNPGRKQERSNVDD